MALAKLEGRCKSLWTRTRVLLTHGDKWWHRQWAHQRSVLELLREITLREPLHHHRRLCDSVQQPRWERDGPIDRGSDRAQKRESKSRKGRSTGSQSGGPARSSQAFRAWPRYCRWPEKPRSPPVKTIGGTHVRRQTIPLRSPMEEFCTSPLPLRPARGARPRGDAPPVAMFLQGLRTT
jgi:hypothetical protein